MLGGARGAGGVYATGLGDLVSRGSGDAYLAFLVRGDLMAIGCNAPPVKVPPPSTFEVLHEAPTTPPKLSPGPSDA